MYFAGTGSAYDRPVRFHVGLDFHTVILILLRSVKTYATVIEFKLHVY